MPLTVRLQDTLPSLHPLPEQRQHCPGTSSRHASCRAPTDDGSGEGHPRQLAPSPMMSREVLGGFLDQETTGLASGSLLQDL